MSTSHITPSLPAATKAQSSQTFTDCSTISHGYSSINVSKTPSMKMKTTTIQKVYFATSVSPFSQSTKLQPSTSNLMPLSSAIKPSVHYQSNKLPLFIGIPVAVVACVVCIIIFVFLYRWYKRKQQLQKDFTPCYSYEHSENEVTDGILFPVGTNSVDLLCVDASPVINRKQHDLDDEEDDQDDRSRLLGNQNGSNNNGLNAMASDVVRCESVSV